MEKHQEELLPVQASSENILVSSYVQGLLEEKQELRVSSENLSSVPKIYRLLVVSSSLPLTDSDEAKSRGDS